MTALAFCGGALKYELIMIALLATARITTQDPSGIRVKYHDVHYAIDIVYLMKHLSTEDQADQAEVDSMRNELSELRAKVDELEKENAELRRHVGTRENREQDDDDEEEYLPPEEELGQVRLE